MLGMDAGRIRELARDALVRLSPLTAARVDEDWRGQVGDYVLSQQSGPEAVATREHLKRSEPARAWVLSLHDSLDELYAGGARPELPDADEDGGRRRGRVAAPATATPPRTAPSAPAEGAVSPAARAILRRRRLAAGLIGLLLLASAAVGAFLLLRDGDESAGGQGAGKAAPAAKGEGEGGEGRLLGQGELQPVGRARGAGIVVIAERGGKRQLLVQAAGLEPSNRNEAYEVWLFNSPRDAVSLGAQVADARGNFQGAGEIPADFAKYRFVDISRERVDESPRHSGNSVLRASLSTILSSGAQQQGRQRQPSR